MSQFQPTPLHQMKTTKWCLTYWLTEGRTLETLKDLTDHMPTHWKLEGQIEQGYDSQDQLHAQLMLHTEQTRGTKIAKYFPNTYIASAQNKFALAKYVHKVETRVAEFKTIANRSPSWPVVRDKFYEWYCANHDVMLKVEEEQRYSYWDHFIGLSMREGMEVDLIGVNPQYRSCINRYWTFMIDRTMAALPPVDRQTDRQTDPLAEGGSRLATKNTLIVDS